MKHGRFKSLWIALVTITLFLIVTPGKADAATSGYYTYSVANGEATITDVDTSITGSVSIPYYLGGYPVTKIGGRAFYFCTKLTGVRLHDGITSVGYDAFWCCYNLTSVTIPSSVTSIGHDAFRDCDDLTGIWVDAENANYSSDDNGVLFDNFKTTLIQAPGSLSGTYAIPDGVTDIESDAFYGCDKLTSVTIPDSVTSIGFDAFYGCDSLISVAIGSGVTSIVYDAFGYCDNLRGIWVDAENTKFSSDSKGVLFDKIKKELIRAPGGLSGDYTIPDGVTSVGGSALRGCEKLTSVTIPDSVTSVGYGAFYKCTGLTEVTIGHGVTTIGENAFYGCDSMKNVTIGNGMTTIGQNAFSGCSSLSGVYITDAAAWCKINYAGALSCPMYYAENLYLNGMLVTDLVIPDGVTSISGNAFSFCEHLTSVTIPDSVTSIGGSAFDGCSGLTSVIIPDSVVSIGSYAFYNCIGLTSVTIPDSLTSIGSGTFYKCTGLTNITIPGSVTNIGTSVLFGCTGLTDITIPDSVTSIGPSAFSRCTGLTNITIPNSVISIGNNAFSECTGLRSITIPDSVTSIGNEAFYYCSGLEQACYLGTEAQWSAVSLGSGNSSLTAVLSYGHNYTEEIEAATCGADGKITYTCLCGDSYTEVIPASHTEVIDAAVAATCTAAGLTEGRHCSVCREVLAEQAVLPALGHGYEDGVCSVCEAVAAQVLTDGQWQYADTIAQALAAAADGYVRLNGDLVEGVTVSTSSYLDLNGYTLTGDITITDGATLYVFDSATADYTADNRGKIVGSINGNLARSFNTPEAYGHNYKYLALEEEENVWSFHRYYLTVKSVILQPCMKGEGYTGTAVDYRTQFKCNELVAQHVTAYGAKLVGDNTVYADYMAQGYTLSAGAGNTNEQRTWLTGTFKNTNSAQVNAANALAAPMVSAYIVLDGEEITSAGVQRSLQDMIVYANAQTDLSAPQKKALGKMYTLFKDVLDAWTEVDITNIKQYAEL